MSPLVLSCIIFVLILSGIFLGTLLRRTLPGHHSKKESQDLVRLGVGLVATIAALALGLLIASAKSSFDTRSSQVKQITADIILLDNILTQYGPETRSIREMIRTAIPALIDRLWAEKAQITNAPFEARTQ
jgi:O-antigen/teichoic acid export membrane protein